MDPDTEAAAWFELELEARHYNEILANDPGFIAWSNERNEERTNEILSEGQQQF